MQRMRREGVEGAPGLVPSLVFGAVARALDLRRGYEASLSPEPSE